jgi:tripartite-type tricarboxylate transporter receptor subunit TctC
VKTFDELISYVKAHPGEVNYASAGVGAATFMVTELLKSAAGLDMVHIPYDGGGPATASIVAGETQFYGSPYATAKEFIENGKLQPLAVSSEKRVSYLPDIPAASESVPGFEFTAWYGLMVPAGTPQDVVDALYNGVKKALADPDVQKHLGDQGYVPIEDTPADFSKFLEADIARMAKLVKDNNLAQK